MSHWKRFAPLLLAICASSAHAQSTATPVLPGTLVTSGCPPGYAVCFAPYSSANPMPTTGSAAATASAVAGTQTSVAITAATALTVPSGATSAFLSVAGTNNTGGVCAYWQDDGTAPTGSTGQPVASLWSAFYTIKALPIQFIVATGATCTLNVSYYK